MNVWCLQKSEESIQNLKIRVTDDYKPQYVYWELNSVAQQKQQVSLNPHPFL